MKLPLAPQAYRDPITSRTTTLFLPIIEVFLTGNHRVGKPLKCYLDTGAFFSVFPSEYALAFLGFSQKSITKGQRINLTGIGNTQKDGYLHVLTFQNPHFRLEDSPVIFLENQPVPLLGRIGFMDRFETIIFHEQEKTLELIK